MKVTFVLKRKSFFIALSLGILVISFGAAYSHLKHQKFLASRHHLLCEVLQFGMSENEVLAILRQKGEFTESRAEWGSSVALDINFTDPRGKSLYGGFELGFQDNKYIQSYMSNFDYFEVICEIGPTDRK